MRLIRFVLLIIVVFKYWLAISQPPIVVSSYFNSNSPENEWTELLVIEDGLSLNGWKLRDYDNANNVWNSDIVFTNNTTWSQLRAGTIIVINHRNGLSEDFLKNDGFIRVSAQNANFLTGQIANSFSINGDSDAIEIRNFQGQHVHSLSHGSIEGDHISTISNSKIHHLNILPSGRALIVYPGGSVGDFGYPNPYIDLNHCQISNNKTPGIPCPTCTESSDFWRVNRQPVWNNPTGWFKVEDSTINWNAQVNLLNLPIGETFQGYIILQNNQDSFVPPEDGYIYSSGQLLGTAKIIGHPINEKFTIENLDLECNETVFYRIYGYRFNKDQSNSYLGPSRARAYNENNYATISITNNPVNVEAVIAVSPSGVLLQGTSVICSLNLSYALNNPEIKWFLNDDPNPVQTGTYTYEFVPENNDIIKVTVAPTGDVCTIGPVEDFWVFDVEECQTPVILSPIHGQEYEICSGEMFEIELNSNQPEAEFSWTVTNFSNNQFVSGYADGNGNQISQTITNTSYEEGVLLYKIKASNGVCESAEIFVSLYVKPKPQLSINQIENICSGTLINFSPESTINGTTFSWIRSQTQGIIPSTGSGQGNINETLTNQTTNVIQVEYNYTLSANNCVNFQTVNVSILPRLINTATLFVSEDTICQGEIVIFSLDTINAGSSPEIRWFKNANQVQFGGISYADVPASGDVYHATVTSLNTCAANNPASSNNITMVVNATSMASINLSSSPSPACSNVPVTISTAIANGGSMPQYVWYLNDAVWPGVIFPNYTYFVNPGDRIRVQLTSNQPCVLNSPVMSAEFIPNVMQASIAPTDLTTDRNNYCANEGGNITLTAIGGAGDEVKWYGGSCGTALLHTGLVYTLPAPTMSTSFFARWETAGCGVSACKTITINVLPPVAPTIGISATTSAICSGENVIFTASATGTGPAPLYQWKVNGSIVQSSTANIFASSLLQNNDKVSCTLLSDNACTTSASVTSNEITMVVTTLIVPQLQITSSQTSACSGLPVDFSIGTSTGGGNAPQYQWKKNGIPQPGETGTSYSTNFSSNGSVSCEMTSNAGCVSQPTVQSNTINISVTQTVTPAIVIQGPVNPAYCEGQTILFTSAITNGGSNPTYQWYVDNTIWPGAINASFNTSALTPGNHQIHCVLHSSSPCASAPSVTSNTVFITVEQFVLPVAAITAPQTDFCPGEQASFTAVVSNQGSTPAYQWLVNGIPQTGQTNLSFSFQPTVNASVSFRLTSSVYCVSENPVTSNVINIVAHPTANVAVSVAASQSDVCTGETIQFTATPQNGGSAPAYTWFVNDNSIAGSNSNTYTYAPVLGDKVHVELQSSLPFCTVNNPAASAPVFPTVHAHPMAPTAVTASDLNVCPGETGTITLSSTGGLGDVLRWYANSCGEGAPLGEGTAIQVPVPAVTTTYYARYETTFCGESACVPVTITVSGSIEPTVQLQVSNTEPCAGDQLTVTADVTGQGDSPVFEWRLNGSLTGLNQPFFVFSPDDGDQLSCTMTSSETCASPAQTSDSYTFSVSPVIVPDITVSPSDNGICAGTAVVFEATIANGGTNPQYQWIVNGSPQGSNMSTFTFTPANGDIITCQLSSNAHCANPSQIVSQAVMMSVLPVLTPEIAITADQTAICFGDFVSFGSTVQNGGTNPVYTWQVNGTDVGNAPNYTYQPDNMDVVQCVLTSSENCVSQNTVSSNSITITATTQLAPAVAISTTQTTVCEGTTVVVESTVENGGSQPTYQWFVNGVEVSGDANLQFVPTNSDEVFCVMTSNATCLSTTSSTSDTLVFSVNQVNETSIEISSTQLNLCEGSTAEIYCQYIGGGNQPVFEWFLNSVSQGTGSNVFSFVPHDNDVIQCVMNSSLPCPTSQVNYSNELLFEITPAITPTINLITTADDVCEGDQITVQADYSGGGSQPSFLWKVNGITQPDYSSEFHFQPSHLDELVCVLTSSELCTAQAVVASEKLIIVVNESVTPQLLVSGGEGTFCPDSELTLVAQDLSGSEEALFTWYLNDTEISFGSVFQLSPQNGDEIKCVLTSTAVCANPQSVEAEIFPQVAPTTVLTVERVKHSTCGESNGELVLNASGGIAPYNFSVDDGQHWQELNFFSDLQPGSYWPSITDSWGCTTRQLYATLIENLPEPEIRELITTKSRTDYAEGSLEIYMSTPSIYAYSLDGNYWQSDNWFDSLRPGMYTLFVRDEFECVIQQSFEISIRQIDFEPGIPNAFRPESLPPNNTFKPVFGAAIPLNYTLKVLNAWGEVIFQSNDYQYGWDGSVNGGALAPIGVYVWSLSYDLPSFETGSLFRFARKGTVMLIR